MPTFITQPSFDPRLTSKAFPLTGNTGQVLQTGYMIWDKPLPGYSQRAIIRYLYNPSTVSSDYNIADASAQAALNFPNPGDTANLALPLSQTATWSLMFDRTFELWQSFESSGLPVAGNSDNSGATLGVQADVLAFMQFTGMLTGYAGQAPAGASLQSNAGIMQLIAAWAFFGNNNVTNGLMYYGYINEWSVQYTHFTQYNVPIRAVINVNWTMMPNPATNPPTAPNLQAPGGGVLPTPAGTATGFNLPGVTTIGQAGIGGT